MFIYDWMRTICKYLLDSLSGVEILLADRLESTSPEYPGSFSMNLDSVAWRMEEHEEKAVLLC